MSGIQTGIELNDQFSSILYGIINAVNMAVASMEDMQQTMNSNIDTSGIQAVRDELNAATAAVDELNAAMQNQEVINTDPVIQPQTPEPVEAPVVPEQARAPPITWDTDNLNVFTGTGIERFQQEVQSTNNMLNTLNQTQAEIQQTASTMDILPDSAIQDINSIGQRIQAVQNKIEQIEQNPINFGSDAANAELEQLRSQLNRAIEEQNDLNQAMQNMDISAANDAYLRLSSTIGNTERYIRDNVDEQGRFNQEISEGTSEADRLMDTIKGAVAAYASLQTIGNALNISDELTQTTSRLNMMNDGLQTTDELVNMVYAAAQDARGSFADMADVVARFGNNAGDAFGSSEEIVAFANLVQKQMTIAGASTNEASNAMLQLSQALGSGVLRGDELNSIFEQAPNLIQNIADYLDVPIGKIREMASEGELSADVVKNAIFDAAGDINAAFEEMPMTWGQIWQSMQNTALMTFRPILQRLNEIANSEAFQTFVSGALSALAVLADAVLNVFDLLANVASFVAENWSIIRPIILGIAAAFAIYTAALIAYNTVQAITNALKTIAAFRESTHAAAVMLSTGATFAQTAAQYGLNAALAACPLTWIIVAIIAIIALLYAAVAAVNHFAGTSISATGIIAGAIATLAAFIYNKFVMIWNFVAAFIEFLVNVWQNPQYAIQAFAVNVATAFLSFLLACVTGTQSAVGVIVGLWYAFVQIVQNIVIAIYNFFASGIEAVVNGWNSGVYAVKSALVGMATGALQVASSIASSMGSAASAIANMFISAANTAISAINSIIDTLNAIPGVDIGHINTISTVSWDGGASKIEDTTGNLQNMLGDAPETWTAQRQLWERTGADPNQL